MESAVKASVEIKDLINVILRNLVFIIVSVIVATAAAAVFTYFVMDEMYEASAVMIISSTDTSETKTTDMTVNDYTLNVKLVNSYRVLCTTDRILEQVIGKLGLKMTPKALSGKIAVTAQSETEIIKISVTDTDPKKAKNIANTVVDVFKQEIPEIMKMDNVQILDYAKLPTAPVSPNKSMNISLGVIIGFIFGFGVSLLKDYFDNTIKSVDQLEAIYEAPVIGSIPYIDVNEVDK